MIKWRLFAPFVAIVLLVAMPLFSDESKPAEKPGGDKAAAEKEKPPEPPAKFVRPHRMKLGGAEMSYTTTAEEIILKDGEGKSTARFFTIAYTKDGVTNPETRPVTFVFNGGPGSASIWLHFGLVGPKLIDIPSDAQDPGAPPYKLRDNPATIFRATDLVFIDPVGTGYSRATGEKKDEDFWGYEEDADSVAEFIRTFITQHNRWNSPKYILGESYGGIRTSLLIPRLQGELGVGINGAILISPALNMATLPFIVEGNDQSYATTLPALAATAFYHHRLPDQWKDLDTLLREVEQFAGSEYLLALFRGDRLDKAEKERIAEKLHRYTGLSKEYLVRSDLRVTAFRFAKELLRDQGKTIGLLDGRYTQNEIDNISDQSNNDPFNAKTGPVYVSSFQSYLRNELGVDFEKRYVGTNGKANGKWKRPTNGRNAFAGFVDVTSALAQGTKDNEALRVFAAGGYNDLVTSYFALKYMLEHSGIDAERLTIHDYPGGHMMYLHRPSADALSNDIVKFIEGGTGAAQ
jgi:carboxypeptidase C (cathepsin A)